MKQSISPRKHCSKPTGLFVHVKDKVLVFGALLPGIEITFFSHEGERAHAHTFCGHMHILLSRKSHVVRPVRPALISIPDCYH